MTMKPAKGLQARRHSLERAYRSRPNDEGLVIELVGVLEHLEDYDELLALIATAIERFPDSLNLRLSRARIVASLGDFGAAREDYRHILEQEPGHVDATCALVQARRGADVGGIEGIDVLLASVDSRSADFFKLTYARARLLEEAGRYGEAFECYRTANEKQAALGGMDVRAKQRAAVTVMNDLSPGVVASFVGKGHPSKRPVFIVGMPRSGTSLTEQILSRHPEVHALGEQTFLGEALRNLIMRAPGNAHSLPKAIDGLGPDSWRRAGGDYIGKLNEIDPDSPRVTDKLPANFALLPWIRLLLPGARVIHVRRHPLATLASCIRTPFADNLLSFTVEDWARFYGLYEALMERWRPILGNMMLEMEYEVLVADLNGQARRMIDFLELDWWENCLRPEKSRHAVRTASVRQVRKGVHMNSVSRWKNHERPLRKLEPLIRESHQWITAQTVD